MQSENETAITMYTTGWCPDCWRAKAVMKSMKVNFQEINIGDSDEARQAVEQLNNGNHSVPTIVFPDGSVLTEPPTTTLVQKLQTYV